MSTMRRQAAATACAEPARDAVGAAKRGGPMVRALGPVLAILLAVPAAAEPPADWTPSAWTDQDTLELTTSVPGEGSYTFPVWLVVVDGQLYVRLGTRAADRVQKSTTQPMVGVTVGGKHFDKVRCEPAPDQAKQVAEAMRKKYWSDVLIQYFPHPLTCRLVPE